VQLKAGAAHGRCWMVSQHKFWNKGQKSHVNIRMTQINTSQSSSFFRIHIPQLVTDAPDLYLPLSPSRQQVGPGRTCCQVILSLRTILDHQALSLPAPAEPLSSPPPLYPIDALFLSQTSLPFLLRRLAAPLQLIFSWPSSISISAFILANLPNS
jgi:hypothetical protein